MMLRRDPTIEIICSHCYQPQADDEFGMLPDVIREARESVRRN
jgi:hypothetical protein